MALLSHRTLYRLFRLQLQIWGPTRSKNAQLLLTYEIHEKDDSIYQVAASGSDSASYEITLVFVIVDEGAELSMGWVDPPGWVGLSW